MADGSQGICDRCGKEHNLDDAWDVRIKVSDYHPSIGDFKVVEVSVWCAKCSENESFYCHYTDVRYADDKFDQVEDSDGDTVCKDVAIAKGWEEYTGNPDRDYWCHPDDVPCVWTCACCGDVYEEGQQDQFMVISQLDSDGDIDETVEYCQSCYDSNTSHCIIADDHFVDSNFTFGIDKDGDDVCIEYVKAQGWKRIRDEDGDDIWVSPEDYLEKSLTCTPVSEDKMPYADFYWRLPTVKEVKQPGDPRVLVLMADSGVEVSSLANSAVKEFKDEIFARAKEAGANPGDSDVLNVYTRIVLIERNILPASYRL